MNDFAKSDKAQIASLYRPERPERVMGADETVAFLRSKANYAATHPDIFDVEITRFGEASGPEVVYPGKDNASIVCHLLEQLPPGEEGVRTFERHVFVPDDTDRPGDADIADEYERGWALAQWAPVEPAGNHWQLPAYVIQEYLSVIGSPSSTSSLVLMQPATDRLLPAPGERRQLARPLAGDTRPSSTVTDLPVKTRDDIMALKYHCYDLPHHLPANWRGTALDVLNVKKSEASHRLMAVLSYGWLPDDTLRHFAFWCGRQAIEIYHPHFYGESEQLYSKALAIAAGPRRGLAGILAQLGRYEHYDSPAANAVHWAVNASSKRERQLAHDTFWASWEAIRAMSWAIRGPSEHAAQKLHVKCLRWLLTGRGELPMSQVREVAERVSRSKDVCR